MNDYFYRIVLHLETNADNFLLLYLNYFHQFMPLPASPEESIHVRHFFFHDKMR